MSVEVRIPVKDGVQVANYRNLNIRKRLKSVPSTKKFGRIFKGGDENEEVFNVGNLYNDFIRVRI